MTNSEKSNKKDFRKLIRWHFYGVDFETFTADGEYFKKHDRTDVYCICARSLRLKYDSKTKKYVDDVLTSDAKPNKDRYNKIHKMYGFTKIEDYLNNFKNGDIFGRFQIHYFHNGMNFDFAFIEDYLKENKKNWWYLEKIEDIEELVNSNSDMCKTVAYYDFNKNMSSNMIFITLYIPYYSLIDKKYRYTTIKFYDSLKYFTAMSIKKFGEVLQKIDSEKYPKSMFEKPDFDLNLVKEIYSDYKLLPQEVKVRCEADVNILIEFLRYMFLLDDFLTEGSDIPMTAASLTLKKILSFWKTKIGAKTKEEKRNLLFKTLNINTKKDKDKINEINERFLNNKWYRGGICTYNTLFKTSELKNKLINSFDVNSLYPSVMLHYLPVGVPRETKNLTNQDLQNKFVFVLLKCDRLVQKEQKLLPPFLSEFWGGNAKEIDLNKLEELKIEKSFEVQTSPEFDQEYLPNDEDDHYFFELKDVNSCMSYAEYEIIKKMCDIENPKISYLVFNREKLFDDFINYYYPKKCECGRDETKEGLKVMYKLFLNSGYGKFGQKVILEIGVFLDDIDKYRNSKFDIILTEYDLNKQSKYAHFTVLNKNKNSFVPLASAITSLARSVLLNKAYDVANKGYFVYYCDTDSIKTDCPVEEFKDVDNEAIGKWKNEGWVKYFKVFKPKFYFGSKDGENIDKKFMGSAGVNKDIMKKYKYNEVRIDMTVKCKAKKRVKGGYVLVEVEKQVKQLTMRK